MNSELKLTDISVNKIHIQNFDAEIYKSFSSNLSRLLTRLSEEKSKKKVVLCIGNPEVVFDALGPIVGELLIESLYRKKDKLKDTKYGDLVGYKLDSSLVGDVTLYGTYCRPIHHEDADVLQSFVDDYHPGETVITIDACGVQAKDNLGKVGFNLGAIQPGSAYNNIAEHVGDLSIYGNSAILNNPCRFKNNLDTSKDTLQNFKSAVFDKFNRVKTRMYNELMGVRYLEEMTKLIAGLLEETLVSMHKDNSIGTLYQQEKGIDNSQFGAINGLTNNLTDHYSIAGRNRC